MWILATKLLDKKKKKLFKAYYIVGLQRKLSWVKMAFYSSN